MEIPKEQRFTVYKRAKEGFEVEGLYAMSGFCLLFKNIMYIMNIPDRDDVYLEVSPGVYGLTEMFPELLPYKPPHILGGYWFTGQEGKNERLRILNQILNNKS